MTRRTFAELLGLSPVIGVSTNAETDKENEIKNVPRSNGLEILESIPIGNRLRTVIKFPKGRVEEMYSIYTGSPSIDYPAFKKQLERNIKLAQAWAKKAPNYLGPPGN